MLQRTIAALGATLLLAAPVVGQPIIHQKGSTLSDVVFQATNIGIFGLNIATNNSSFVVPRGSNKAYLFGSGIWFGAQKIYGGEMRKLMFITYNPNSGSSWAMPGEGYMEPIPGGGSPASPELFHSTDYDRQTGMYTGKAGLPDTMARWPLWLLPGESATPMRPGHFAPYNSQRSVGGPDYFAAPALVPDADEQFISRFHDNSFVRYEKFDSVAGRTMGYPIGLQIQQNIYAWRSGPLKDAVVLSFMFINTSSDTLRDCVIGHIWDPDLGQPDNDHGAFYTARPDLRTVFNWSPLDGLTEFGALTTTLIAAPVVDAAGFVDNSRRAAFRRDGRARTFRNWSIEEDPSTPSERYDFASAATIDPDLGPGDKRGLLSSPMFSMRPGDTAYFAIGLAVIPESPARAQRADGEKGIASEDTSADLERVAEAEMEFYYSQEGLVGVPGTPVGRAGMLSLLPNPARERVSIGFVLRAPGSAVISLVDGMGEVVATRRLDGLDAGEQRQDLDLSGVPSGAYIVTVRTAGGFSTSTLTVVR